MAITLLMSSPISRVLDYLLVASINHSVGEIKDQAGCSCTLVWEVYSEDSYFNQVENFGINSIMWIKSPLLSSQFILVIHVKLLFNFLKPTFCWNRLVSKSLICWWFFRFHDIFFFLLFYHTMDSGSPEIVIFHLQLKK